MKLNDLEREIDQLLGWYSIKRKYISGLVLTVIGTFVLIVDLIVLRYIIPGGIVYHYNVIVYNGPLIRLYVGIIMGGIGGLLLLIGLPLLIINTKKKKSL
ncbi:unnamed protein product [marine sediment metagenome]|uniref:Uncharacterized protein n=1 Tax=marine sediment metagenome TaxID=412755 RepID=X1GJR7_9ZZZZ